MMSARSESDAKYDAEKRRTHPDYPFWRSRQWRDHIRPAQLRRAPLCEVCAERGVTTLATQVDHRIRPMGDYHLQRDPSNLRSCCASCHSRKTMADQRGFAKDVTVDGYPTDPNHLANKPRRQTHNTGGGGKNININAFGNRWGRVLVRLSQKILAPQRKMRIARLCWEGLLNGVFPPLTSHQLGPLS